MCIGRACPIDMKGHCLAIFLPLGFPVDLLVQFLLHVIESGLYSAATLVVQYRVYCSTPALASCVPVSPAISRRPMRALEDQSCSVYDGSTYLFMVSRAFSAFSSK